MAQTRLCSLEITRPIHFLHQRNKLRKTLRLLVQILWILFYDFKRRRTVHLRIVDTIH
eukprot:UN24500